MEQQGPFIARERSILRQLDHPLIVNGIGTAADAKKIYLAFEPVFGGMFNHA